MIHFWWIANLITINGVDVIWVGGGPRVISQQIAKQTLSFEAKAQWALSQHRLGSTTGDNVLNLVRTTLVVVFKMGFEFDIGHFIAREIWDRVVGGEKFILVFPCLITQICLEEGVPQLPEFDQLIEPKNTTNLGIIQDAANPMTRQAKKGTVLLARAIQSRGESTEAFEFSRVEEVLIERGKSEP